MSCGYESVFKDRFALTEPKPNIMRTYDGFFKDPIVQVLLQNSNLTEIQFESLLISLLGEELVGKRLSGQERVKLRRERADLTRGSFNRTVGQARSNVVASIYTILLLGYVGVFESPELEPFLEIASRVKAHLEQRKAPSEAITEEELRVTRIIAEELQKGIADLVRGGRRRGL